MNTCNDHNEVVRDITALRNRLQAEARQLAESAAMQALDYERRNATQQHEPLDEPIALVRQAMLIIVMIGTLCVLTRALVALVNQ